MSNLSVNTITDASGGSTASINGLTPQASNMAATFNRIINGAMTIAQRGASLTNPNGYTLDRWLVGTATGTTVVQQSTNVPSAEDFSYSLYFNQGATTWSPTGAGYSAIAQSIEGYNVADLRFGTANAKTTTLSFWVYASLTGTYNVALSNSTSANFSAGATRSYVTTFTVASSNTWQKVTITIAGDTAGTWAGATNAAGITLIFSLGSSSDYNTATTDAWQTGNYVQTSGAVSLAANANSTFYITGVQLEAGSTASPFAHENYSDTLRKCQRYYQLWDAISGIGYGSGIGVNFSFCFPTVMRASPTIGQTAVLKVTDAVSIDYSQSSTNITISAGTRVSTSGVMFSTLNFSGTVNYRPYYQVANETGKVTFSAEL
jgi:hypothetical protein